ncbi:MAG TPA: hypothetical protein IAB51_07915 [Candidatus Merdivicinus excrementipullorum]|uniref:Uroporphyrinogen decarboxylase (URO-D) domain-containing protein n=1 Tax=Candidatus Merdivicinus excrementipullorum TaxID=2840867 RepID=A0A9D1FMZ3_9FIRM|nr:hypothetical protein [Candidatus Merdivicinus excrementipullorum]
MKNEYPPSTSGTPQQVWDDAARAISCAGKGGGLILGSSHSLTIGAALENILTMKRAREELGTYPLKAGSAN